VSRWYVTDGSTETDLPKQLEPAQGAYSPPLELNPVRGNEGTALYYEGDGLPVAGFLELVGGVVHESGGVALYEKLASLNSALATATSVVREESDGTITWPLRVGYSHARATKPIERLSNYFTLSVRLAVSSTGAGTTGG
jgi:hypothetical protein